MNQRFIIIIIFVILILLSANNLSFAQGIYLENLKFKTLYTLSSLIPNPVQKISILNSLADNTFKIYLETKSLSRKKTILNNYLIILRDLEKTWKDFSFNYSQFPKLFETSIELYVRHLKTNNEKIKNSQIQDYLIKIILNISSRLNTTKAVSFLNNTLINYGVMNLKIPVTSLQNNDHYLKYHKELLEILKELKILVEEFEKGERIVTGNYKDVENKILEIQKETNLAMESIKQMKFKEVEKNIKNLKEVIKFIKDNSKKVQ